MIYVILEGRGGVLETVAVSDPLELGNEVSALVNRSELLVGDVIRITED